MKAIAGLFTGAFAGWVVGYIWTLARCTILVHEELSGNPFQGLGDFVCSAMAPKAPDTIIIAVVGSVVGLGIGLLAQNSARIKDFHKARRAT